MRTLLLGLLLSTAAYSQGTLADYQRAEGVAAKARGLVLNAPGPATWIGDTHHFWYWRTVKGGTEFVLADAATASKKLAFDHERLASAISTASGGKHTALALPFAPPPSGRARSGPRATGLTFVDSERAIEFNMDGFHWRCTLTEYVCTKGAAVPADSSGRNPEPNPEPNEEGVAPEDGILFPQAGSAGLRGRGRPGCAPAKNPQPTVCGSFDGKWEALIQNFNVHVRPANTKDKPAGLSQDGSEGNYYSLRSLAWSPDSTKLVAYRTRPGYDRQVHFIESSPADQLQPKHSTISYRKPGDALDVAQPVLFDVPSRKTIETERTLFPNAYNLTPPVWWKDSRGFTFEYNQRGHQVYRVIEVDAATGKARTLIDEQAKTFFYYNLLGPGMSGGRRYRHDIDDGKQIIWASERDGWGHLYLYDGVTGKVKNQITKGNWLVRNVDYVDDKARQIWFDASGTHADQDPYFTHHYRINFDGTGLTAFTQANGNHVVTFSKDRQYYVDTWSRVDQPPISQLRRASDRGVIMQVENADASALLAAGFRNPEVFVAKGRDGTTDIWGIIVRPTNFDPTKKYPVIEQIYAGPQGSFVPKTFTAVLSTQALAELGFIVVQIDGMGTSNRSKAFHDVAHRNLGDAGFPDRILWHKAVAAKYAYYDITRVGIYGTSAGGQNSMGGMLFHPDFYKVAVTNSGCHDNRMDKIWWNEQWMGWPLGAHYAASSNVDNAHKLQGKVLIIIPEMDSNVDPTSSLQVVNALVKAKKRFDMLFIPGQNHGTPALASQHYLQDYFVHHLLGVEPPDWNRIAPAPETTAAGN
ncbi:MAG: DPP IV N-terminal domain-containing protein [Acidobacteria bacterium]|nr:DPP IV N-terminal domain-containing protein [Acidobacteriota bacterium]